MNKTDPRIWPFLWSMLVYTIANVICGVMMARAWYLNRIRRLEEKVALHRLLSTPGDAPMRMSPRAAFLKERFEE